MRWNIRRDEDNGSPDSSIGDEVEEFLHGHYLDIAFFGDSEVPAWVWLSALAHGEEADLAMAEDWMSTHRGQRPEFDTWGRVLQLLARKVRKCAAASGCSLSDLQRDVLVPLELTVMAVPVGPATLYRIVSSTLAEIESRAEIDHR